MQVIENTLENQIVTLLATRCSGVKAMDLCECLAQVPGSILSESGQIWVKGNLGLVLKDRRAVEKASLDIEGWKSRGIQIVSFLDEFYPQNLRNIYDPPLLLFYRGVLNSRIQEIPLCAMVGSRRADNFGCEIASRFAEEIARAGNSVVSGLALGVDAASHRGALRAGGNLPTIGVMGSGFDYFYPALNRHLAEEILKAGGLLLSQFEPDIKPLPINFLKRNRIIAGLSEGVLVIQATGKSGSLVTARFALEEGRDVLVVPGSIHDPRYEGSNNLIKKGAYLVTTVDDVFDALSRLKQGKKNLQKEEECVSLSPQGRIIVRLLKDNGTMHYDTLANETAMSGNFAEEFLKLELDGIVLAHPGNYVSLTLGK